MKNAREEIQKYFQPHAIRSIHIPDTFIVRKSGKKDTPEYAFVEFESSDVMMQAFESVASVPISLETLDQVFALPAPHFRCMSM